MVGLSSTFVGKFTVSLFYCTFQRAKVKKRFSELQDLCTIEVLEHVLRFAELMI